MDERSVKRQKTILSSYGILIMLYSVFYLLVKIIPSSAITSMQRSVDWAKYIFFVAAISSFTVPMGFVTGYGLFRHRYWSRYAVIATMATIPVALIIQFMMWGAGSFHLQPILFLSLFAIAITSYFSSASIKQFFDEPHIFRMKSWGGLLVVCIIFSAFSPLIPSIYAKVIAMREGQSFFAKRPQVIILKSWEGPAPKQYYRGRLLDASLVIPESFGIRRFMLVDEQTNKWSCFLYDTENKRGSIMLGNRSSADEFALSPLKEQGGLKTAFDYERFMLTNDWNPIAVMLRTIVRPNGDNFQIKEIHINDVKGFLKTWERKDNLYAEFSLYDSRDVRSLGGVFLLNREYFSEQDMTNILSTIEFLKSEDPQLAKDHYEKGLRLYDSGTVVHAQYEFANAYYLSPDNADYIYALAKTLPRTGPNAAKNIKEMLDAALKINPNFRDAQQLLKEIEPRP